MKNQTIVTAGATLLTSINWDKAGINPQAIIDAAKAGRIQGPLTDWLASQAWNEGKDFEGDFQLGFKPVSINDIPKPCNVLLRYKRNMNVVSVNVK